MKASKAVIALSLLAATGAVAIDDAHAALGVDFDKPVADYLVPGTAGLAGWSFTAKQDLYVTRLGIYDHDADRFDEGTHTISLWKSDGTFMTSVTFSEPKGFHSGGLVNGKYHMIDTSATLLEGQTYVIAATMGTMGDPFAYFPDSVTATAHHLTFNPYLTYNNAVFSSNLNAMPGVDADSAFGNFGANIDVTPTPIPAAAWLLGSGLLGLVGIRRKNR
ncbi:MAG: VPLPA-CTERM sorting domain-containing protein [Desulfuromonadales bacterium]|nr:MAG: VPLPA-CTERM sorting domain-containing protein [Desulfuromonadales bacterium]